jgi:dipeptidase D
MSNPLARLEPRPVWDHFWKLTQVPRPSKHEERVVEHVRSVAAEHGIPVKTDGVGNLILRVPATPGHEKAPVVILQGHLDMVCEKNKDTDHDFMSEPIRPRIDGDWVYATGTTLGADNGIGVAAALAVATDPSVVHGPLELLLTLDEETGLTGALKLDGSLLEGRTLLNLDSEEDGVLFVGCAGGADSHLFLPVTRTAPAPGGSPFLLEIAGLRGGHSGLNIHENRGNAVRLLARILLAAMDEGVEFELGTLSGGSKHNAIPREAEARIHLSAEAEARLRKVADSMAAAFAIELEGIDPGLQVQLTAASESGEVIASDERDRLLRLLMALPHGVLAMSPAIPGLVETSNNVAVVVDEGSEFKIVTASRSSVAPAIRAVLMSVRAAGQLAGARVEAHDGYPGWKPNLASKALQVVREVYTRHWRQQPKVTAIHAGLECGLLGEKVPGLDMISFGPQIEGAHSPEERLHIDSVGRFWEALKDVLADYARA